jgi:UDP-N-acetylmuramate dehydrogenase
MISEQARKNLMKLIKGKILFDEPMEKHTSLHIGGPVNALIIPRNEHDLKNLLNFAKKNGIPLTVMGNGTKLLVSDKGIDGIVVKINGCIEKVTISGTKVKAGAGYLLANLSRLVANHGLSGLEFAVGIPGTVGGGVVMNAGAHGFMMSDILTNVTVMNVEGKIKKYSKNDLEFGYRQSKLQNSKTIVFDVEMKLKKDDADKIEKRMREYIEWRKKNQPLDLPNAGSIFKNPTGIPAGKLIDMAGLKGMRLGNAKISEKRANFIVNLGNATALDVLSLMNLIREKVLQKFGIWLEPEIRIIGRFN